MPTEAEMMIASTARQREIRRRMLSAEARQLEAWHRSGEKKLKEGLCTTSKIDVGDMVLVKLERRTHNLDSQYRGPFRVLSKVANQNLYNLEVTDTDQRVRELTLNGDDLKLFPMNEVDVDVLNRMRNGVGLVYVPGEIIQHLWYANDLHQGDDDEKLEHMDLWIRIRWSGFKDSADDSWTNARSSHLDEIIWDRYLEQAADKRLDNWVDSELRKRDGMRLQPSD
jgi:hypothetical protein